MLDLKPAFFLSRCSTEWSSWTEATFLRWTLHPTSSRSGDSSTECAGKLGWSRSSLGFVPWSWCPGVQMWHLICVTLRHTLNRALPSFVAAQTTSPRGHCQWISRAAADAVPICWFSKTQRNAVLSQEKTLLTSDDEHSREIYSGLLRVSKL